MCDTMSFLRDLREGLPRPTSEDTQGGGRAKSGKLEGMLADVTVSPHFLPRCLSVVIQ